MIYFAKNDKIITGYSKYYDTQVFPLNPNEESKKKKDNDCTQQTEKHKTISQGSTSSGSTSRVEHPVET